MLKHKINVLLMFCTCILAGCSSQSTVDTTINISNETETYSQSEEESVLPERPVWLKETILIEAGIKELSLENLVNVPSNQNIQLLSNLTEEQLRTVNGNYQLEVQVGENTFIVNITVIDTTPPVIEGLEDLTITSGESVMYLDGVSVSDNSGETLEITVDKSNVKTDVVGKYTIIYSSVDSSGNSTSSERVLTVEEPIEINEELILPMADAVIKKVTKSSMSDWDKAKALWTWCHDNITYSTSSGDRTSVWTGAYEGLYEHFGDCYTYYATYEVLLTRVGIPNMKVARINGKTNHWWNLVNVGDGWYHCDCSPRNHTLPYECFMQTDAQLEAYSKLYEKYFPEKPDYFLFDKSLYPERETKEVFDGNMHHIE